MYRSAHGFGWVVRLTSAFRIMLHCNMNADLTLQHGLEDLLADLRHARRSGDLGRLALLAYCEVRRWARKAGESDLAAHSSLLITGSPHPSREVFLGRIDQLITQLEQVQPKYLGEALAAPAPQTARSALTEVVAAR